MFITLAMCLLCRSSSAIQILTSDRPTLRHDCDFMSAIQYSREFLLKLQYNVISLPTPDFGINHTTTHKKKRGSRGGIRNRLKRCAFRPPLPAITFSNVRSLQSKMDELSTLTSHDSDYRRSSIMCFTETWLTEQITDLEIDGYTTIRFDRDKQKTEKSIGGGL